MDGLQIDQINDDNRTYSIVRARCIVAEFLSTNEVRRELDIKEFQMILEGVRDLQQVEECDECLHPISKHGPDGCTHNRHIERDGVDYDGPCGCSAVTVEPV